MLFMTGLQLLCVIVSFMIGLWRLESFWTTHSTQLFYWWRKEIYVVSDCSSKSVGRFSHGTKNESHGGGGINWSSPWQAMWWKRMLTYTRQLISVARSNANETAGSPSTLKLQQQEAQKESVQEAHADLVAPQQPCTWSSKNSQLAKWYNSSWTIKTHARW